MREEIFGVWGERKGYDFCFFESGKANLVGKCGVISR